ncbi:MAG: methyltransferase domain-containing protein [Ruminococcus flavefaciens]|nr:methyltransferase domain-containing protein [Ruminococcus flavefaciens]MCM1234311.1 methyltransferase domain-containing protein [Ruminococcus flavefaciens]
MSEISITELGNPAKPQGEAGALMLARMGISHRNVTEWALSHLNINGAEKVLDIGCGGGDALKRMSALITTGHLTGADYSEVSVELSRKNNADDIACGKMDIIQADVANLPFDDNYFDIIYTIESFYFWKNPVECLREVRRVLAPDGVFMIIADINGDADLSQEEIDNIKKYNLFNPTLAQFRELLTQAGFSCVKIHTQDGEKWVCAESAK